MTITQIEYFLAVVECGSFSAAANHKCFVTQPSLSTQIKNLEDELGVLLLDRSSKPIVPTKIGAQLINRMNSALAEFYAIKDSVYEQKKEIKGSLVLAAIPTISPYILHKFIPSFAKEHPELNIEVKELYTHQIEQGLLNGSIDIGLLAAGFINSAEVKEEILFSDKFYLYVSSRNRLYGKKSVDVGEIDINDIMLLPDGHCLRSQVINLCDGQIRQKGDVRFESGSLETILRMVDSSNRTTIIPHMMLPFISKDRVSQVVSFKGELSTARRDIAFAVSSNFYKHGVYKSLKNVVIESTMIDRIL